jgi:exopolysaccharide production protein ExoZ
MRMMMLKPELPGLQYLRAAAVLLVVFDHINIISGLSKYFGHSLFNHTYAGALGVNIFFVLSGFIISYISIEQYSFNTKITYIDFIWRRFIRIVPFLWACISVYAFLRCLGRSDETEWLAYLRAATFFPVGTVNPTQTWTLRHEIYFYLVFSTIFVEKKIGCILLILWIAAPFFFSELGHTYEYEHFTVLNFLFSRLNILFGFGMILGIVYLMVPRLFPKLGTFAIVLITIEITASLLAYSSIQYSHESIVSVLVAGGLGTIAVYLSACIQVARRSSTISIVFLTIGNASYAIYLTHGIFISSLAGFISRYDHGAPLVIVYATLGFSVITAGTLIHFVVERPLLHKLRLIKWHDLRGGGSS